MIICGEYTLRNFNKKRDWQPKHFPGSYSLDYKNKQVGVVAGSINRILRIDINPKSCDHGTKFIELLIKEAKRQGYTTFMVEGVIGDTANDKEALEHILREKLGFKQKDEETWVKNF